MLLKQSKAFQKLLEQSRSFQEAFQNIQYMLFNCLSKNLKKMLNL